MLVAFRVATLLNRSDGPRKKEPFGPSGGS